MDGVIEYTQAQINNVLRQSQSNSRVTGMTLWNTPNGGNRFGLIVENPEGTRFGAIYKVEPSPQDNGKLCRKIDVLVGETFPDLKGAPSYKLEYLGEDFWDEQF